MSGIRLVITVAVLSLWPVSHALAYPSIAGSDAPPGKWKWYYTLFNDVGAFQAPSIFWGSATVRIKDSKIRIEMKEIPPDTEQKKPAFSGTIDSNNQIDGKFDGILTEDARPMRGHYRKMYWGKGPCFTETIVLEEKLRNENVLVFRRGTPAGC